MSRPVRITLLLIALLLLPLRGMAGLAPIGCATHHGGAHGQHPATSMQDDDHAQAGHGGHGHQGQHAHEVPDDSAGTSACALCAVCSVGSPAMTGSAEPPVEAAVSLTVTPFRPRPHAVHVPPGLDRPPLTLSA